MNQFRGEAPLVAGNETFKVVLDVNAMVLAEDALDTDLANLITMLNGRVRVGVVRALLWAGLQHMDTPPNLLRAGEIIGAAGIGEARAAVMRAVAAAMPKPEPKKGGEDGADPRLAAGGIGNGSTGAGAA